MKKTNLPSLKSTGLLAAVLFSAQLSAFTPSAEQVQMFEQLSPSQQSGVLQAMKKRSGGTVSQAKPTATGVVVAPRKVETPTAIEQAAAEAADVPDLQEKAEKRVVKEKLKQFGYDLFAGTPTTFAPATDIPVPSSYVMGPGDEVNVLLFGKENKEFSLVVTREGDLNFPGIGPISVAGLTFAELKETLHLRISQQMIGVNANITLGALRSIRVFLLGDVHRPGSYTVSALTTLTNALFVGGGIRPIGSLRNIQLKRNGNTVIQFDLYDLLLRGDTSRDVRLLPGDVVFVPPIGETVGVSGEVRRPAIYELADGEQTLGDAIRYAGGLQPTAYPTLSQVERIDKQGQRTLIEVDLADVDVLKHSTWNGDVVRVYSVLDRMDKVVELSGHLQRPGGVQWREGMRVSDIISSMDQLLPEADMEYALIRREMDPDRHVAVISVQLSQAISNPGSDADLLLMPRDQLTVFSLNQNRALAIRKVIAELRQQARYGQPEPVVSISGNVRFPGEYPLESGMRISRLIRASLDILPETDMEYALIRREHDAGERIEVLSVALSEILASRGGDADIVLHPRDQVTVFKLSQDRPTVVGEIVAKLRQQARYGQPEPVVSILGNVRFPGEYPLESGMRISRLIRASLDILPETDLDYALLRRESADRETVEVVPVVPREVLSSPGSEADLLLLPRDQLSIFSGRGDRRGLIEPLIDDLTQQAMVDQPAQLVTVQGRINAPGSYPMTDGMRIRDLVVAAGGLQEAAYTLGAEVTHYRITGDGEHEATHASLNLSHAINGDSFHNHLLQPHDIVTIKEIPMWNDQLSVTLSGEVRFPGTYPIARGETLSEVIVRAGGFTEHADVEAAFFQRELLRKREAEQKEALIGEMERDIALFSKDQAMELEGASGGLQQDTAGSVASMEKLLEGVKSTKVTGRLVIPLRKILEGSAEDVMLQGDDSLHIPQGSQEITVMGEVLRPHSQLYDPSKSRDDYITASGGTTIQADKGRIYVVRSDGSVANSSLLTGSFFKRKLGDGDIRPGDTIVVPMDLEHVSDLTRWTNISQIIYQFGLAAASANAIGLF